MQQSVIHKEVQTAHKANHHYTESLTAGILPLNEKHIEKTKSMYPELSEFIDGLSEALLADNRSVPAVIFSNFVIQRYMFENAKFGEYGEKEGLKASMIKFSFVHSCKESVMLYRYETLLQQKLRDVYLVFNMDSMHSSKVDSFLSNYDMSLRTMCGCGDCGISNDDLQAFEVSNTLYEQNDLRRTINELGIKSSLVTLEELKTIKSDAHADDLEALARIEDLDREFALIDKSTSFDVKSYIANFQQR